MKPNANQENTQKPSVPVYIPTPKHILEARKANGSSSTEAHPASKKPRLEYIPKAITNNSEPIPTYIPSSVPNEASNDEYEPSPVYGISNAIEGDAIPNVLGNDLNGDDISGLLTELSSEEITNHKNDLEKSKETTDLKESKDHKSKENSHKTSSSSSSRHRHHSSSSSTHKSSHSNRKSSSRSSSSTHRSSHHSARKSKHSDKDKVKEKSKQSSKSSKESRHTKSEYRSKSSSSSSSSSRHHPSSHSDKKTHNSNNDKTKDCKNSSVVYEMDSEEDDVEAQCRMIFEEFDPSTLDNKQDEMPNGSATSAEEEVDDITKKKWVAHENADKQIKSIAPFRKKTDHVKNALQV